MLSESAYPAPPRWRWASNAQDTVTFAAQDECASDDRRVAAQLLLPEGVCDDCEARIRFGPCFLFAEASA